MGHVRRVPLNCRPSGGGPESLTLSGPEIRAKQVTLLFIQATDALGLTSPLLHPPTLSVTYFVRLVVLVLVELAVLSEVLKMSGHLS